MMINNNNGDNVNLLHYLHTVAHHQVDTELQIALL